MAAKWFSTVAKWVLFVCLVVPLAYVSWLSQEQSANGAAYWDFVKYNYIVFFGMPYAAAVAYFLVTFVEGTRGPVEFSALGLGFKGAAGPLVFWVLIFLSIVVGFKALWRNPMDPQVQCANPAQTSSIQSSDAAAAPASTN